jgi:hypothetical protein
MAYRLDVTGEHLRRTTSLPSWSAFTICGWFYKTGTGGSFAALASLVPNASDYSWLGFATGTSNLQVWHTSGGFSATIIAPADNTWFFAALVHDGATTLRGYGRLGTVSTLSTQSTTMTSQTPTSLTVGEDGGVADWFDGRIAAVKAWDAVLTSDELVAESHYITPMRYANLHLATPLFTTGDINDYSGAGRNWTSDLTPVTEDGPPIAWAPRVNRYGRWKSAAGGSTTLWAQSVM